MISPIGGRPSAIMRIAAAQAKGDRCISLGSSPSVSPMLGRSAATGSCRDEPDGAPAPAARIKPRITARRARLSEPAEALAAGADVRVARPERERGVLDGRGVGARVRHHDVEAAELHHRRGGGGARDASSPMASSLALRARSGPFAPASRSRAASSMSARTTEAPPRPHRGPVRQGPVHCHRADPTRAVVLSAAKVIRLRPGRSQTAAFASRSAGLFGCRQRAW